uniref:Uncharacterized protein n=1 Tax=viral metagenome TaxID=1070528 RepID=A0A6H2A623_9ZZZZ
MNDDGYMLMAKQIINRLHKEIKYWSQEFTKVINNRLCIIFRSRGYPQKIYFSDVSDKKEW